MNIQSQLPNRQSHRLKGYDYSMQGLYFVTICQHDKQCLFANITNGKYTIKPAGEMITRWYNELQNKFPNIKCRDYVVMPNHFHCIIEIVNKTDVVLGTIIQWFKTMTTNEYIRGVKELGWERFNNKLWQRDYYENIIMNDLAYDQIITYINTNKINWVDDKFHIGPSGRTCVSAR